VKRRLFVLINRATNVVVRRLGLRRYRGGDLLYLTTVGRNTGQSRNTPLLYLPEAGRWIVVASNGGAYWDPGWWLNLQAGSPATVQIDGTSTSVTGTEVTGDEREQLWRVLNEKVFNYNRYQARTRRHIAVVALTPVADESRPPGASNPT
jgi:deazaflavin-dependent oxidoreductase (nitroreductase family)